MSLLLGTAELGASGSGHLHESQENNDTSVASMLSMSAQRKKLVKALVC